MHERLYAMTDDAISLIKQAARNPNTVTYFENALAEAFKKGKSEIILTFAGDNYKIDIKLIKDEVKDDKGKQKTG